VVAKGAVVAEVVPVAEAGWSKTTLPTLIGTLTDTAGAVPA
jgi:hypothetical protein